MFEIFGKYPNIIAAISEKKDGTMKLVEKNRQKFLGKLGVDIRSAIRADLVQGNNVEVVSSQEAGKTIVRTDGLITIDKNLFLTITVADCLPIFIFDPEKEIISLIHGGWRNLAKNILTIAIEKMTKNFGSLPEDILIEIGPGISQCHFEVKPRTTFQENSIGEQDAQKVVRGKEDLLAEFKPYLKDALIKRDDKVFLDLKKIAKIQLMNLGVKKENIEISPECTFCLLDKYFSFRRDKFKEVKTMLAVIGQTS